MATNLESRADKAVRDAVDAFMDGRLVPRFEGEVVFETANSRYRLLDGVVFAAPDTSLVGAELVGWLSETKRRCLIEWSWQPGSRAVLVDRKRGRSIIVTSTTRLMHQEEQAPPSFERAPELPQHNDSWSAPPFLDEAQAPAPAFSAPVPAFSARRVPIIASTPPPTEALEAEPTSEPPSSAPPSTIPRARGIWLPSPAPPEDTSTPGAQAPMDPFVPVGTSAASDWELTSAEFEMEASIDDPSTDEQPPRGSSHHDATRHLAADALDPVNSVPFPLLRAFQVPGGTPRR